ncbi:hypothetical protein [Streptomyces sp. NPDC058964]|uniref:hypothetical protein n=1 Tax=Streptomyces sp. NPDC058964 TaxID=3346681 RepID=UPI0036C08B8B
MRSTSVSKSLLVTALGCMVLSGCGTQHTTTDRTPAGSTVSATAQPTAQPSNDPEMRFLALMTRIMQDCGPNASGDSGKGEAAGPADLPGGQDAPTPGYGPGETPPGVADTGGDVPIPVDDSASAKPAADPTGPKPAKEVPLTGVEKCSGTEHAQRVSEAFEDARTTSYQAMREMLTRLDYPASRIHRMPDHAGAPRARLDLRMMGSHLALEVTRTGSGAAVEAFGVPETEDVKVTDVKRKPQPDAPTS